MTLCRDACGAVAAKGLILPRVRILTELPAFLWKLGVLKPELDAVVRPIAT